MAVIDELTKKRELINLEIKRQELESKRQEVVEHLTNNPNATFKTIFEFIPRTSFAIASGINAMRMSPRADDPTLFRVGDLLSISEFLKVSPERVFMVAMASLPKRQKTD